MNNIMNVTEYDNAICKIANKLSYGDRFLAEELRSEMYITILSSEDNKSKAEYLREAKCRAIDYMRSKVRNYSYEGAFQHISLEAMEQSGFQIDTEGQLYSPKEQNSVYIMDSITDPD
jgi:hypothetical protein